MELFYWKHLSLNPGDKKSVI
ncbi:UNVERIFIED_CONTAM: hypothetical protein GTU68_001166 [Idotea baltica]|nr:hypothetical protein [Idotea baltica]